MTFDLRRHGHRPALLTAETDLSYTKLAERVDAWASALGPSRRLIVLRGSTSIEFVVALLAAFQGGHPVILAPPARDGLTEDIVETFDPDILVDTTAGVLDIRRETTIHSLHPDLALLLSTSGSTGSPKLVRLSHAGLRANAAAIATYLDLGADDRGLLSLPLHYCYGLSILTSHLYAGAACVVTDWSILDPCLWEVAARHGVTGLAGVPHTFDQLDCLGFPELASLRYVTAAGGKLDPNRVRTYGDLGRRRGWDFYVMYGQTEATARMAYLTPDLARDHPAAIGVPIPGGHLRVDQPDSDGVGELVFTGPNVMMGYAHAPTDLAQGAELHELHTGDLAREAATGVFEVVGRRARFAKIFGLRLDLDDIERRLPFPAACVDLDGTLGVMSPSPEASQAVADLCNVPTWTVRHAQAEVPLTASGKPDRPAVSAHLGATASVVGGPTNHGSDVRSLFARLLCRTDVTPDSSFVTLGADSLSYVELSVRLGELIEQLPRDWHRRTVAELESLRTQPTGHPRRSAWVAVDPTVVLRSVAILLIVGTHANLLTLMGGAHALLAVCGYNAARFLPAGRAPATHLALSAWRIAVPSALWIGALATFGLYAPTTALFLNGALGADHWTTEWQFWFLEAVVWTLLGLAAALTIPWIRRLDAHRPFVSAMVFVGLTGAPRYALVGFDAGPLERYSIPVVAWCFALGWAAARTETTRQRLVVFAAALTLLAGFFADSADASVSRESIIALAIACLLWAPPVRMPRWLATACGVVAAASLSIYLTHWQVYPWLEDDYPLVATLSSVLVGVLYDRLCRVLGRRFRMAVNVDRRIEGSTDQNGDRQHVQEQQHRDRRRQWSVDGRIGTRNAKDPAHEVATENPHDDGEDRSGDTGTPGLPDRHGQVIQAGHEADREHEHGRPVHTM